MEKERRGRETAAVTQHKMQWYKYEDRKIGKERVCTGKLKTEPNFVTQVP